MQELLEKFNQSETVSVHDDVYTTVTIICRDINGKKRQIDCTWEGAYEFFVTMCDEQNAAEELEILWVEVGYIPLYCSLSSDKEFDVEDFIGFFA